MNISYKRNISVRWMSNKIMVWLNCNFLTVITCQVKFSLVTLANKVTDFFG